jgi:hypothetical protein
MTQSEDNITLSFIIFILIKGFIMLLIAHHHKLQHDLLMAFTFDIMLYLQIENELKSLLKSKS